MSLFKRDRGFFIWTYSGRKFYPLDPHTDEVHITDIARGLSNECRYSGQVAHYYSVAEHCLLISKEAETRARINGWFEAGVHAAALWGLLHDATEAYIGDIVRPLKYTRVFKGYRKCEQKLELVIREHFKPWLSTPSYVTDLVRKLDTRILADESIALITNPDPVYIQENFGNRLGVTIRGLLPEEAEQLFLERFRELVSDYA